MQNGFFFYFFCMSTVLHSPARIQQARAGGAFGAARWWPWSTEAGRAVFVGGSAYLGAGRGESGRGPKLSEEGYRWGSNDGGQGSRQRRAAPGGRGAGRRGRRAGRAL